jgi:pyridoxal phosphate enzyme (YggS family)
MVIAHGAFPPPPLLGQPIMTTIAANLQTVRERIAHACTDAGRDVNEVTLLAVSKTFGPDAVRQACSAGASAFGENYIQEAIEKQALLADLDVAWHCIGPIQSNKTRLVATHFDWAQTVDRLKIAQRLADQRPPELPPLNVCIQVNVDGGASKSGVPPGEALALGRAILALPRLRLRGLMSIPEPAEDFVAQREVHARARDLFHALREAGLPLDTLSMGMTDDLEAAIHAGSTMVRVGTAIFGRRAKTVSPV